MSLGLPAHLAPLAGRRSFILAQHAAALTILIATFFAILVAQGAQPYSEVWLGAIALAPAIGLLLLGERTLNSVWAAGYLLAIGAGIYVAAVVVGSQPQLAVDGVGFSFLSFKLAAIMVGGAGVSPFVGVAWTFGGYLVAELATTAAMLMVGHANRFDLTALVLALATSVAILINNPVSRRQILAQPRVRSAVHAEQLAALRYRVEVKAAALMHDTVLNHLAAIAETSDDELSHDLADQVRRDVDSLVSEDWLAQGSKGEIAQSRSDWQSSGLFLAIQEGRMLGLDVDTTGDLPAVGRLDRATSIALGLAVKQCLVNVLKHSGTRKAEVAVYAADDILSVLVVDGGRGFIEEAAPSNRFGLKVSIRKRMELAGGRVDVWSTPGRGTSIMIQLPVGQGDSDAKLLVERGDPL